MKEYEELGDQQVENVARDVALTGTPEERARKMSEIYHGLETMEEKLEFLVRDKAYHLSLLTVDGENESAEESDMRQTLQDEFFKAYIENGTKLNYSF